MRKLGSGEIPKLELDASTPVIMPVNGLVSKAMLLAVKVRVGRPQLDPLLVDVLTDPLGVTVTSCPASRFPALEKVPIVCTDGIVKLPESTE